MTGQIVATYGSDPFQMTRDVLEHIDLRHIETRYAYRHRPIFEQSS